MTNDKIKFIVGSELRLGDILHVADVMPLLKAIITAGADAAAITDEKWSVLWAEGAISGLKPGSNESAQDSMIKPIYHEGEPIGFLCVSIHDSSPLIKEGTDRGPEFEKILMDISMASLDTIVKNTVKRMLTTELHTTVVEQSYEDLIETNKRLSVSEKRYRELAETLEQKVEERTADLKKAHAILLQQEKMASIGQLAAGIAHEINNPISFINSNISTLAKYAGNLQKMIQFYKGNARLTGNKEAEDPYNKLKIDFILNDIHALISQSREGAERIKDIVANLKDFSHIDETAKAREVDINAELDNTIKVLSHEIKARSAEIVRDYGSISGFYGNPGMICQAFLNVMMNALQSRGDGLVITVKTGQDEDNAIISVTDNGVGIPSEVQSRIFEPFFTTRDIGKGRGMGLTVVYEIVSARGGSVEVNSEVGKGTTLIIRLPLRER
jgi:signal transduction histidine kinase